MFEFGKITEKLSAAFPKKPARKYVITAPAVTESAPVAQNVEQAQTPEVAPKQPFAGTIPFNEAPAAAQPEKLYFVSDVDEIAFGGINSMVRSSKASLTEAELAFLGLEPKK